MNGDQTIRGFAFPFRIDPRTGGVATTAGPSKLKENLTHLLQTRVGERLMVREYGGGVHQLLHENINSGLIAVARHQIGRAMLRFEPRVLPQEISVIQHEGTLYLRLQYIQADTPGLQTLAVPISG
jgi:phage baseplate assembly protein W